MTAKRMSKTETESHRAKIEHLKRLVLRRWTRAEWIARLEALRQPDENREPVNV